MITKKKTFIILFALLYSSILSQNKTNSKLKNTLEKIISSKKADVGISIIGTQNDVISIKAEHFYLNKKD